MQRYIRWTLALLLGLVLVIVLWRWNTRAAPFMPLPVERQKLGHISLPSSGRADSVCLTDLDGNGEPELLMLCTEFPRSGIPRVTGMWCETVSATQLAHPLPVMPILPSVAQQEGMGLVPFEVGNPPLLREIIGLDPSTHQILKVRRQNGQWQVEPIQKLQGERFKEGFWTDIDGDGRYDDALLLTQSGKLAWLEIDTHGRWHLRTTNPNLIPTPAQEHLQMKASLASIPPPRAAGVRFVMTRITMLILKQSIIPDIDGDGQAERLTKAGLQLSRTGRAITLDKPGWIRQAIFVAELDGEPPLEIISTWIHSTSFSTYQITVDRFDGNQCRRVARWMAPARTRIHAVWCRDIDGDGRAEIVLTSSASLPKPTLHWRLLRLEKGKFQQTRHIQRLSESLEIGAWYLDLSNTLAFETQGDQARRRWFWETPRRTTYTLLAGLPRGSAGADPSRWETRMVEDMRIAWAGDYDGDGLGEVVLQKVGAGEESWLLQYREDGWYRERLSAGRRLITVLPAHIKGQPRLILVYQDKGIEIESLAISREK